MVDPIPFESEYEVTRNADKGMSSAAFRAFNTLVSVRVCAGKAEAEAALESVRDECRRYERLFSKTLPNSDVSRVNASRGAFAEVAEDTFRLVELAKRYCARSEGLFDITMGPVLSLWSSARGSLPSQGEIDDALSHVGYRGMEMLDLGDRYFVRLADPLAALDLGGIAKGYIADALSRMLEARSLNSYLINLGGNVYARGRKPDGSRWKVGIRDPLDASGVLGALELENASAVTSGTYERRWLIEGKECHHILSPLTGRPVETDLSGVTVVARRSLDAEGYSTTLLAMGLERGRDFARRQDSIMQAHFVTSENKVVSVVK